MLQTSDARFFFWHLYAPLTAPSCTLALIELILNVVFLQIFYINPYISIQVKKLIFQFYIIYHLLKKKNTNQQPIG